MKHLLLLLFFLPSLTLADVANPAVPGTVYNGTDDKEVFKMLIFSCFENCNSKYYESMYVPKLQKEKAPPNSSIPFLTKPSGRAITIIRPQEVKMKKNYLYPDAKDGVELIQYEIQMEELAGFGASFSVLVGKVDGKYYLLRPYSIKN